MLQMPVGERVHPGGPALMDSNNKCGVEIHPSNLRWRATANDPPTDPKTSPYSATIAKETGKRQIDRQTFRLLLLP